MDRAAVDALQVTADRAAWAGSVDRKIDIARPQWPSHAHPDNPCTIGNETRPFHLLVSIVTTACVFVQGEGPAPPSQYLGQFKAVPMNRGKHHTSSALGTTNGTRYSRVNMAQRPDCRATVSFVESIFNIGPSVMRCLGQVDAVGRQVLERPLAAFRHVFVGLPSGHDVLDLVDRGRLAQVIRNVGQVAVGAGQMPFQDIGMQQFRVASLDRIDEIAEMIAVALELPHQFALGIEGCPAV